MLSSTPTALPPPRGSVGSGVAVGVVEEREEREEREVGKDQGGRGKGGRVLRGREKGKEVDEGREKGKEVDVEVNTCITSPI